MGGDDLDVSMFSGRSTCGEGNFPDRSGCRNEEKFGEEVDEFTWF